MIGCRIFLLLGIGLAYQVFAGRPAEMVRVGILSDTHITDGLQSIELPRKAFETFRDQNVDLVIHLGDLANRSCPNGYVLYRQVFDEVFGDLKPRELYVYAGHDAFKMQGEEMRAAYALMKEMLRAPNDRSDFLELGGYPFVVFPQEVEADEFERRLSDTMARYPQGPVFVADHVPAYGTTYGSVRWGSKFRRTILEKFPRVVHLSGHAHGSMRNERLIWQGAFTEINFGCISSLKGWAADLVGQEQPTYLKADDVGVMEIRPREIIVRRFCVRTGEEYRPERPWRFPLPFNPRTAPYAAANRPDRRLSVSKEDVDVQMTGKVVRVSFVPLSRDEDVFSYRVELKGLKSGDCVREVLAPFYLSTEPFPRRLSVEIQIPPGRTPARRDVTVCPVAF